MIIVTNIRNARREYDENWAIVRSMKNPSDWIQQVTDLSPTTDLFFAYRSLAAKGNWNADTFNSIYVPRFMTDIKANAAAKQLFSYLYDADKAGKTICLTCFCPDETLCHRSIIAGILAGSGCNVVTDTNNDYSKYFNMYMESPTSLSDE